MIERVSARNVAASFSDHHHDLGLVIVAALRETNGNAFGRTDQRRIRLKKHAGFADLNRLCRDHLRTRLGRRRGHFVDVGLIIGRRTGQFHGSRHRRQKLHLRQSFARRFVGEPLEPLAPLRQRRNDGIALHRIRGGVSDFGLRLCDIVHDVAAHDPEPVLIVAAKLHKRSLGTSHAAFAPLLRGIVSRLQIAGKRIGECRKFTPPGGVINQASRSRRKPG